MAGNSEEMRGMFRRGRIWYFQPAQVDGARRQMISLETDDLSEALATKAALEETPDLAASSSMLAEIKAHLTRREARRDYTRSTAANKLWLLKAWATTLPARLTIQDIQTAHLQDYYDDSLAETSIPTAHKRLMSIRAFLNDLVELRKIRSNPAIAVKEIEVPHVARVLYCTREQRDKLIHECTREDLKFVLFAGFHAGLRKNEIVQAVPSWFNLERRHLDLRDTPTIRFTDKKRARKIPMRQALHDFLLEYGLREPFMLRPDVKHGKGLYRYDFEKPFKEYVTEQGMKWVTPHVLRHTFASLAVIDGKSIYKVSEWLGDRVTTTENTYVHLAPYDTDIEESVARGGSFSKRRRSKASSTKSRS